MNWQTYLPTPEQIEADQWKVEEALQRLWAKSGYSTTNKNRRSHQRELKEYARTVFGEQCFYCQAAPGNTLDHLIPKSLGGNNVFSNVVPACQPCNVKKGNRLPTTNEMARHRAGWAKPEAKAFVNFDFANLNQTLSSHE